MAIVKVTDESFEQDVLKADRPVLVDFWAEWCGPCKQIAPALEQIAQELGGAVTIAKVNIEDSPTTPSRYGVLRNDPVMIYGPGRHTAGHSGWGGSCLMADPERRLSAAYVMNRQSAWLIGDPRSRRLIDAVYEGL